MFISRRFCLVLGSLLVLVGCSDATTSTGSGGVADVSSDSAGAGGGVLVSADAEPPSTDVVAQDSTSLADAVSTVDQDVDAPDVVLDAGASPDVLVASDSAAGDGSSPAQDVAGQDVTDSAGAGDSGSSSSDASSAQDVDAGSSSIGAQCFSEILDPANPGPDYDQFSPIVGSHCMGTNHQDIVGVEQVVILGDSVTQGTPNDVHPTCIDNAHFYRNELSEWLADTFGLDRGDLIGWGLFKTYSCLYDGAPGQQISGDFHNCSKWGARTDDLVSGGGQVPQCFPGYPNFGSDKKTLVFFTMGGNDISKISQVGADASDEEVAAGYPEAWALAESTVAHLEEAMAFFKDPAMFPSGAYVVFANPFEFTDGTGQTSSCSPSEISIFGFGTLDISDFGIDLAGLAGYGAWEDQSVQEAIVIWILEQYMRVAVDYQVDLVWLLESFCGHGFVATGPDADTESRCYRGPDAELYFDITCIHPNDAGHHATSELFKAVIGE